MPDLGPFPGGMNNRAKDHELPEDTVRNLVNVDVSNSGNLRRRKAIGTKVYSGINCRNSISCDIGVFFVEGADIKQLNSDNTATTLEAGITFGTYTSFEYQDGVVYFSDGVISRKIYSDGTITDWGMDNPNSPVFALTTGNLTAGQYIGAVTWVDSNGVESGASDIETITLNVDSKGIIFQNLPTTTDSQIAAMRLYLSMPNGSTMFYVGQVALGTGSYSVQSTGYDNARHLESAVMSKMPAGIIVRYFAGRMWVVDLNGVLWYSEPFSFDLCKRADNWIQMTDAIKVMEPVDDGIYLATETETKFYAGTDPRTLDPQDIFEYGGILGTGKKIPNTKKVCWMSQRGMIEAGVGGAVENKQEGNVATELATHGATMVREEDGVRQFVTSIHNPTTSTLACRSWIEAEVIRKGA